jgi:glycosyltransferase involved in cell wall biosynthesis
LRITFYSNFLNHHQLPFCMEMVKLLGNGFKFIATEPTHQERLAMGYHDINEQYEFCICSYKDNDSYNVALKLGVDSDVVIIGSAPNVFIEERLVNNKLTFRYSERIFKKGRWHILSPRTMMSLIFNHTRYINNKLYMLCASAYTSSDFAMAGAYLGKTYKWGYFPQVIEYDVDELMTKKKHPSTKLLWCGRFIDLKHPELPIMVAKKLKEERYSFNLTFIGNGPLEDKMKELCVSYGIEDSVVFLGAMSPEKVRENMESANIYLFTSDFNEGWGAVLNESMNSACAVVASHAIGSVPFLIKHNENGLIYKNGDLDSLVCQVKRLMDDRDLQSRLGLNAYQTMSETWNAKIAAERLLILSETLMKNNICDTYSDGPCSRTELLKNDWYGK